MDFFWGFRDFGEWGVSVILQIHNTLLGNGDVDLQLAALNGSISLAVSRLR
jgi:hypothetical protein